MERPRIQGYEVGGPIGFGAAGAALAVRDRRGVSCAAVLVPRDERVARLAALAGLVHAHLTPIRDVVDVGEDRSAVIMDLAVGPSLATLVNARSWLTPGEVATVWRGISDGLAALHRRGLVHGDVSPANIIVGVGGTPVLVDVVGHGGAERGHTGYIPPELDDGPATEASDVWSLARTLTWASGEDPSVTHHVGAALSSEPVERPTARDFATWSFLLGPAEPVDVPPAADLAGAQLRAATSSTILSGPGGERRLPGALRGGPGAVRRWSVVVGAVAGGLVVILLAGRALGTTAGPDVQPRAVAPQGQVEGEEVRAVVGELLAERDAALAAGDGEGLAALHVPGSRIAEVDAALVGAVEEDGLRLEGFGTDVLAVDVVDAGARSFVARVELRQRPHTRVDVDGSRRTVAEQDPHCALVSAVERGVWRIADVTVCPDD